jgi:hypothetical protein
MPDINIKALQSRLNANTNSISSHAFPKHAVTLGGRKSIAAASSAP